jgi:hypothetical protein
MLQQGSKLSLGLLIFILLASFICLGFGVAIYGHTITKWWIPVIPAAMVALGTAPMIFRKWERLVDMNSRIVNFLCHIFVFGSITYFLFLGLNDWCADPETIAVEHTEVIGKYQKAHTRYRRVSRRSRVADGQYYTYHIVVRFEDGREKELEVPFNTYRRTRNGSHRDLTVEKGLFGISVIKRQVSPASVN